jgi:DNA invertase Pin-like site-specific DNA recombinase
MRFMIYGYARVSTDKPDQETSLPHQIQEIEEWAMTQEDEFGGVYVDDGVSAFKVKFMDRPNARRLHDALWPGDTVVATTYSRLWRQASDRADTRRKWNDQQVTLQIIGQAPQKPQRREATNEWILNTIGGFTDELRSRTDGDRQHQIQKKAYIDLPKTRAVYGSTRPYGWRKKDGIYVECKAERKIAEMIVDMKDNRGMSFNRIVDALKIANVKKPYPQKGSTGYYHKDNVIGLYKKWPEFPIEPQSPSLNADSS